MQRRPIVLFILGFIFCFMTSRASGTIPACDKLDLFQDKDLIVFAEKELGIKQEQIEVIYKNKVDFSYFMSQLALAQLVAKIEPKQWQDLIDGLDRARFSNPVNRYNPSLLLLRFQYPDAYTLTGRLVSPRRNLMREVLGSDLISTAAGRAFLDVLRTFPTLNDRIPAFTDSLINRIAIKATQRLNPSQKSRLIEELLKGDYLDVNLNNATRREIKAVTKKMGDSILKGFAALLLHKLRFFTSYMAAQFDIFYTGLPAYETQKVINLMPTKNGTMSEEARAFCEEFLRLFFTPDVLAPIGNLNNFKGRFISAYKREIARIVKQNPIVEESPRPAIPSITEADPRSRIATTPYTNVNKVKPRKKKEKKPQQASSEKPIHSTQTDQIMDLTVHIKEMSRAEKVDFLKSYALSESIASEFEKFMTKRSDRDLNDVAFGLARALSVEHPLNYTRVKSTTQTDILELRTSSSIRVAFVYAEELYLLGVDTVKSGSSTNRQTRFLQQASERWKNR